jgi:flagellar biosynthesis/type III secretory pathway chaperone
LRSQDLAGIVDILTKEVDLLRKLHSVLVLEQEALVRGDAEGIRDRVEGQIEVVKGLAVLEEKRKAAFTDICPDGDTEDGIGFQTVIDMAGDEYAGPLEAIRSSMRDVLKSLGQVNRQNDLLIRQSLSYVDRTLRAIAGETAGSEVYDSKGDVRSATGRIAVDRRA